MSSWRGNWNSSRRTSLGYNLQFTSVSSASTRAAHVSSVVTQQGGDAAPVEQTVTFGTAAAAADDDVWDEELPQDALHEALILESQAITAASTSHASRFPGRPERGVANTEWEASDDDLMLLADGVETRPRSGPAAQVPQKEVFPTNACPRVCQNTDVPADANLDTDMQYKLQGEVSLLRAELSRRQSEIDSLRQQTARQTQQLQQQHEQQLLALRRSLDALQADLRFKDHELSQANMKFKTVNSPSPGPRRKIARLCSSPGSAGARSGFITREEFAAKTAVVVDGADDDSKSDGAQEMVHPASCSLAPDRSVVWHSAVASALVEQLLQIASQWAGDSGGGDSGGGAAWSSGTVSVAISRLLGSAGHSAGVVASALTALCGALSQSVVAPFTAQLAALQHLQSAYQRARHMSSAASSRCLCSAEQAAAAASVQCVSALHAFTTALGHCFTVRAALPQLAPSFLHLLCQLLRPSIIQNEVRNAVVMEYTFRLAAELVTVNCAPTFVDCVLKVLSETVNTRPSSHRLLSALLQLLIALASGDSRALSRLWCRHQTGAKPSLVSNSTCFLKKLTILFNDGDLLDDSCTRYTIPSGHSKACPSAVPACSQPSCHVSQCVPAPAVDIDVSYQLSRLVALVLCSERCRPRAPCCVTFITTLTVRVMSHIVLQWRHSYDGSTEAGCWLRQLIASLHLLSSLGHDFPAAVTKVRLHYLLSMESMSGDWQRFHLTPHSVELLRELYRFKSTLSAP